MTEKTEETSVDESAETPAPATETAETLTDEEKAALEAKEAESSEQKEDPAPETEAPPEPEAKPKKSRASERIRELNTRAKDAEAKQKDAERRAQRAEARLAALQSPEPKPESYEQGELDPNYLADLAAHKTALKGKPEHEQDATDAKADGEAAAAEALQAKRAAFAERINDFRESAPDFDEVVLQNPNLPISGLMEEMILESDLGPQIAYHLGKNPRQASDIANLTNERDVARHFGRIEADLTQPPARTITKAPAPIRPAATGGNKNSLSPHEMTVDDMESHLRAKGII